MINFNKAMESETPPTIGEITAERDQLNEALKKYKVRAATALGITIVACIAATLYLSEKLSGSMDMVLFNVAVAFIFVVAMTLHRVSEQQANINALKPYEDSEEVDEIKNRSAQAAVYLTQIKDRDVVFGEVSLIKGLILQEEKRNAAEAKKKKNQALRRKYLADIKNGSDQAK